jgi:hypothetical protein
MKRRSTLLFRHSVHTTGNLFSGLLSPHWEEHKGTATFPDDKDPSSDVEPPSEGSYIPLSFKLQVAKEFYNKHTLEERKENDRHREGDGKNQDHRILNISDNTEQEEKLRIHERSHVLYLDLVVLSNVFTVQEPAPHSKIIAPHPFKLGESDWLHCAGTCCFS